MTDFGMAKLLGSDPRLTLTYCPGTNAYMSPEALADPPTYTSKLDVFSCGVLFVQLITRKWPNPGPRTRKIQISDPRVPSGHLFMVVPELERRKEHLDLVSPTHPLLQVALDCLKDKEGQRPTAEQLCSRLIALKESAAYRDSLQGTPERTTGQAPPARDQELEQQLRESESRVENLTRENWRLHEQIEEKDRQLQASRRENEQKDAALRAKDELLQEKEREIRELQQRGREREGRGAATEPLKLEWRDGPPAPFATFGHSVAVSGEMVYCLDGVSGTEVLMFNSRTGQWTVLPECPKRLFSVAVVNGQLTAIGGTQSGKATNTLLSLPQDTPSIFQQKWIEQFPPMTHCHCSPAVTTSNTSLIVAAGWGPDKVKSPVEVMDIQTLQWSTVASLPYPLWAATATIFCGDRIYIGGGFATDGATESVVMCEVKDLLATRPGLSSSPPVWKEVAPLPVVRSSLVTFQDQLLAVGGVNPNDNAKATSGVMQYDATKDSWKVISHMKRSRQYSLAAVIPNNTLMVCGGGTPEGHTTVSVELASL